MANTSGRMLQLLSLLQTHRYWPGSELANRLEVSERTLRRDVDRLRELGYPVEASRGVAGGYQLQTGSALPPLLLDDEEAVAIAVGLRTAAAAAVAGIAETSVRALAKVIGVLPPRLRHRVDALQAYTVPAAPNPSSGNDTIDASTLTVIAQACRDDERLEFGYVDRDGARTQRLVEPHRLVALGRRWYLVAWDTERHDWRTFRVDRLSDPRATGARFRPRELPAPDAATFVQDRLSAIPRGYQVEARIHAPAASVRALTGHWAAVEELDGDTCLLTMNVDDFDWPAMLLGWTRAEFEVLNPPELRDHLREMGERWLRGSTRSAS
jgi:predicted DNA-binding transcriptional regulator YafY